MMTLILFALATVGMTNILVHGRIFDDDHLGWRSWLTKKWSVFNSLLTCYECAGWWSGLVVGFVLLSYNPLIFLPAAFAGAALMHAYVHIINLIESKTDFVVSEDEQK